MKKTNIKKFKELFESIDSEYVKNILKNSGVKNPILYHKDLDELSEYFTKEFESIQLPFTKKYEIFGVLFDIKISNGLSYSSHIDWDKFMNDVYEIDIKVPIDYDLNYLSSTLIHELRHIIDFSDGAKSSGLSSFLMDIHLRNFNIGLFSEFYFLVYLSLEHELLARNNQIYPYIKFKNLSKEESLNILKKSFIWDALQNLNNFDSLSFIKKFKTYDLIEKTNFFIKNVLHDNKVIIEDDNDLIEFYNIWDEHFKDISKNWTLILLSEVDRIYERKMWRFNEGIRSVARKILIERWVLLKTFLSRN
jgi:hypothetical protein